MSERISRFVSFGSRGSLWITTVVILALALATYLRSTSLDAANFGNFIAGVASAIALVWLVAGYRLQSQELANQRNELALQRLALEQQAKELSATTSLSSLTQIHSILDEASLAIKSAELNINQPSQIMTLFFDQMPQWKVVLESRSPNEVQNAYMAWLKIEGCARAYIHDVATAMKLYIDHNRPQLQYDANKNSEEFVYIYQSWVKSAPYLSKHIGVAGMLSQALMTFSPGLEIMQLAWLCAAAKLLDEKIVKAEAAEELRKKALDRGATLPKICDPWPFGKKSDERELRLPMP